ncbi:MAG: Hsp20/alpha crystallin family protein [Candidatus Falkowbacteria bacterium]
MLLDFLKSDKKNLAVFKTVDSDVAEKWFNDDAVGGQLLLDVFSTDKNIIIKSAMAGVRMEDLNVSLSNGLLTVRGQREANFDEKKGKYVYKECYWGSFSRSIVLPEEVDSKKIEAFLENGVLTIILNKVKRSEQNINVSLKN